MRVWVTRDEGPGGGLSTALTQAGLDVVREPVVARSPSPGWTNNHVESLSDGDLLVLTSAYAIELLASLTPRRSPRVAVVGEASRKAAVAAGFQVAFVADEGDVRSLFRALRRTIFAGRVCYPRSAQAPLPTSWAEVTLDSPVLYDTVARGFDRTVIDRVDLVAVASPSAARAIGAVDLPFASIGPTTSKALVAIGITPVAEALDRSFESLAAAIASYASDSRHQRA